MAIELRADRSGGFMVESCCYEGCGIEFCMPMSYWQAVREDGRWWYCPNGHKQHYTNKETTQQENERLKRALEEERQRSRMLRSSYDTAERRRAAMKGVATRRKRKLERVKNGVCPCCNRSFQNLARHMKTQHPDFKI